MKAPSSKLVVSVCLTLLSGCVEGIAPPTAYSTQRYLCAEAASWTAAVEACARSFADDKGCGGVLSFQGRLEGSPLVVESPLHATSFLVVQPPGAESQLADVETLGESPYFRFTFKVRSIGGRLESPSPEERRFDVSTGARGRQSPLTDAVVDTSLRLSVGGDSVDLPARDDSGEVFITRPGTDRLEGRFKGAFGAPEDEVEGCFVLFAQGKRTVAE